MDTFIKKIFEGKSDNTIHLQMQKFSRGEFNNRAMVNVTKVKDRYNIVTTYEYASDFVREIAEKMSKGQTVQVTGAIISTRDLSEIIKFKDKKQFMGIKQYIIDDKLSKEQIIDLCNKLPSSFLALSFSIGDTELKIKPKAPKSAKPSSSGGKAAKPDFCKIKTPDINIVKGVLFDVNDFKKVEINHKFLINDIIISEGEKDPAKMREMAIRKGKIIRTLNVDGKNIEKEINFQA
ncbi:MAG: hypothetical protein AABX03_00730 [Nanoarchaeota archaeon]